MILPQNRATRRIYYYYFAIFSPSIQFVYNSQHSGRGGLALSTFLGTFLDKYFAFFLQGRVELVFRNCPKKTNQTFPYFGKSYCAAMI